MRDKMETIKDLKIGEIAGHNAGFQATQIAKAVEIIKRMKSKKATVFLSFTSNMVASGLRGIFAELCKRKFVDAIITAGGSLDHDLIRAYDDYYIGDFFMDDVELHKKGINRLGNILIPNERYELLERKIKPVFERLYTKRKIVSPSEIAREIGGEIGKTKTKSSSFLYWAARNNIPVFCPGITDSAIGLQTYFFKQNPKFREFGIDVTKDMSKLAQTVLTADKTGAIVLGGGISKHYTIGVNILRGGLNYAVYVTTASPWDGSLSGARTQEAISWGKINEKAGKGSNSVTVDGDATVVFPMIMSQCQ
ncbi:MAG: deoxyhypusine synthase [Candidatus Aenigmarchaeota archaeon]|nr:deoxyhypusine synthase [Candidatus Aenigmarchaeota archaeon]